MPKYAAFRRAVGFAGAVVRRQQCSTTTVKTRPQCHLRADGTLLRARWSSGDYDYNIDTIPMLEDNYSYLISSKTSDEVVAVDVSDATVLFEALSSANISLCRLKSVWTTHHHWFVPLAVICRSAFLSHLDLLLNSQGPCGWAWFDQAAITKCPSDWG